MKEHSNRERDKNRAKTYFDEGKNFKRSAKRKHSLPISKKKG